MGRYHDDRRGRYHGDGYRDEDPLSGMAPPGYEPPDDPTTAGRSSGRGGRSQSRRSQHGGGSRSASQRRRTEEDYWIRGAPTPTDAADAAAADDDGCVLAAPSSSPRHGGGGGCVDRDYDCDEDVYIVRQHRGYLSIGFSVVQGIVLIVMMSQCGVAPLNVNPMIGPYPDALNYWGAKNAVLIIDDGEWWRLITPIFLHAGVIHLLCNVSVQLETGAFFEREWGSGVWLLVYLSSAIGSSILSSCFMPNSISVGSSGAVMGLFGAKLSEVFCRACESRRTRQGRIGHEVRMEQLSGVMCSVVLVGLFSFIPYVDWAAHLGGLVAGMMVGLAAFSFSIRSKFFVVLWFVVGAGCTAAAFTAALGYMYNNVEAEDELRDVCEYYKRYFEDYECNCQLEGD